MLRFISELPVRIIAWLSDLLEISLRSIGRLFRFGQDDDADQPVGFSGSIKRFIGRAFWFFARLSTYPFAGFFFRGERFRFFLYSIPFFLLVIGVLLVSLVVGFNRDRIFNRYLARVQNAYSKQEGEIGVRHAMRWIDDSGYAIAERKFLYSLVLMQADQQSLAERVLETLSPEDASGLGVAHFWRASKYTGMLEDDSLEETSRADLQKRFHWHLERASGVSPSQIAVLKALDAFWDGRSQEAVEIYRGIWQEDPFQSVGFAAMLKKLSLEQERVEVLKLGSNQLLTRLRSDPWNRLLRTQLALIYESLEEWSRAENVYLEGFQINRDSETLRAYREFLDRRTMVSLKEPIQFRELAYCLVRIVRTQGSSRPSVELLSQILFRSDADIERLQNELQQWLVEGLDLPIVHLCLAYCKAILADPESSRWHSEQAIRYERETREMGELLISRLIENAQVDSAYRERLLRLQGILSLDPSE